MARPTFDQSNNEQWSTFLAKLNIALDDLYAATGADTSEVSGEVASSSLTTAAGATASITITDATIAAADKVFVAVKNGTNSAGTPVVTTVTPGSGSAVVVIQNIHASAAFNGTLKLDYYVVS